AGRPRRCARPAREEIPYPAVRRSPIARSSSPLSGGAPRGRIERLVRCDSISEWNLVFAAKDFACNSRPQNAVFPRFEIDVSLCGKDRGSRFSYLPSAATGGDVHFTRLLHHE